MSMPNAGHVLMAVPDSSRANDAMLPTSLRYYAASESVIMSLVDLLTSLKKRLEETQDRSSPGTLTRDETESHVTVPTAR